MDFYGFEERSIAIPGERFGLLGGATPAGGKSPLPPSAEIDADLAKDAEEKVEEIKTAADELGTIFGKPFKPGGSEPTDKDYNAGKMNPWLDEVRKDAKWDENKERATELTKEIKSGLRDRDKIYKAKGDLKADPKDEKKRERGYEVASEFGEAPEAPTGTPPPAGDGEALPPGTAHYRSDGQGGWYVQTASGSGDSGLDALQKFGAYGKAYGDAMGYMGYGAAQTRGFMGILSGTGGPFSSSVDSPWGGASYGYGPGGSYAGGYGGVGGSSFDVGGFIISSGYAQEGRDQTRKLKFFIDECMMRLAMGDIEAITSIVILISRQSREVLKKAALVMLNATQKTVEQSDRLTKRFMEVSGQGGQMKNEAQGLGYQINNLSIERQMYMNQFKDVIAMSEEMGNIEKGIVDMVTQQKRYQSRIA